jgi:uncharacterized membrane protein (UPF0127 family)
MNRWLGAAGIFIILIAAFSIAFLKGCDGNGDGRVQAVKIGGKTFFLEVAADNATRMKGLGQREQIADDGGMLFVFTAPQSAARGGFVMRDCRIDIDIIYVDGAGRVINWHHMTAEPPRASDGSEGKVGDLDNDRYESRLKKYSAEHDYQFAIELQGGMIAKLQSGNHPITRGQKLDMPVNDLKARAK